MTTTTHKIVDTGWNASEWTRDVWIGDWLIRAVTTDDQAGKEYVTHYYSGPKDRIANAWLSEDEVPAVAPLRYNRVSHKIGDTCPHLRLGSTRCR